MAYLKKNPEALRELQVGTVKGLTKVQLILFRSKYTSIGLNFYDQACSLILQGQTGSENRSQNSTVVPILG